VSAVLYEAVRPARTMPDYDRALLWTVLLLLAFSVVMVYSASIAIAEGGRSTGYRGHFYLVRQCAFAVIGLTAAAIAFQVPMSAWQRASPWLFGVGLLLLALVLVPGVSREINGARRWLPLGIVSFEPSEVLKPAFALYLARSLHRKQARIRSFGFGVLPHLIVLGIAAVVLLMQPDFGAAMVLVALSFGMMFAAGARPLHLGLLCSATIPAALALIWTKPYRWARLVAFLDPWGDPQNGGFQLVQSLLSFGSGGVFGTGLGNGKQKMFYLPEGHTDFIFALVGEELGLVGGLVVLGCFAVIALRGFRVATRTSDDFSRLLAFGLTFLLVVEAAMNVAVVVGLLPTKGLPLPLVSYGGSSMIASVVTVAVLLGLSRDAR